MTIGDWTFEDRLYDSEADVLYLSVGRPRPAYGEETPEGHVLMFDAETGEFCGVTLIGIRALLERGGDDLVVTLPRAERLHAAELRPALSPA